MTGYNPARASRRPRKPATDRVRLGPTITISGDNHEKLLQHLTTRLDFAKPQRDALADRFEDIDRQLHGLLELSTEDRKRDRDNRAGRGLKPTDVRLPLTITQLDECNTVLTQIFFENDMYQAIATPEQAPIVKGLKLLMERSSEKFQHFRQIHAFMNCALKYNIGHLCVEWEQIRGNKIRNDGQNLSIERNAVLWAGNKLEALDPYNTLMDPSVHPCDVALQGEFVASVRMLTHFVVDRMRSNGEIFNADKFGTAKDGLRRYVGTAKYYRAPPIVRRQQTATANTDWSSYISMGAAQPNLVDGVQEVTVWAWITPEDFGLPPSGVASRESRGTKEMWRFTILGDCEIVSAQALNAAHGMLPVFTATPVEDNLYLQPRSYAEQLNSLEIFASYLMNVHQRSSRKKLYGITLYDQNVMDLSQIDTDETMRIPARPHAGKTLDQSFRHFTEGPDTANTMSEISNVLGLMQRILPTDQAGQVASLERATVYQAAAVVQGSNRRHYKTARLIDSQAMQAMRMAQIYNILENQKDIELVDENGQKVNVNPVELRDLKLEFAFSPGLQGIDRLIIVEAIKEMLMSLLQSPSAWERIDMVEFMDYWTSLMGDRTTLKSFAFKHPLDALPPEMKNLALQLFQQAQQAAAQEQGQP